MIEAVGRPETCRQAFYARDLAGTVVLVGVPTPEMKLELPLLDVFVTETIALDVVEKAFERMHHGDVLRSVVVLWRPGPNAASDPLPSTGDRIPASPPPRPARDEEAGCLYVPRGPGSCCLLRTGLRKEKLRDSVFRGFWMP